MKIRISKIQPVKDQTLDETLAEHEFDYNNGVIFGGNDSFVFDQDVYIGEYLRETAELETRPIINAI